MSEQDIINALKKIEAKNEQRHKEMLNALDKIDRRIDDIESKVDHI